MNMCFAEEMAGTYRPLVTGFPGGEFRFQIAVDCRDLSDPRTITGEIEGKVYMTGVVDGAPLRGTIEISPLWKRTIAYKFTFPVEGKTYKFDGRKSISILRPTKSMTTLPGAIYDEQGRAVAEAITYFDIKRDMVSFLKSYRFRKGASPEPV